VRLRGRRAPLLAANLALAGTLGVLIPAAGPTAAAAGELLGLFPRHVTQSEGGIAALLEASLPRELVGLPAWVADNLDGWAWPLPWLVLALMAFGLWRAFRRGWKQLARRHAPLGWLLLLQVAWVGLALCLDQQGGLLSLVFLTVLLVVFCVADLTRGIGERLVLAPPAED